jgi:hypothetical protein
MERSIKEEVETPPAIILQESRNVVLPDEPKSKKSVSAFAILTFVLALAAATISVMHVMGYIL